MNANEIFYRFSPLVQDFIYANGWETLRPIQVAAAEVIFDSDDNLILCSDTASGKTEAVFFPILSQIEGGGAGTVEVLYIAPLKSLINDQFERIDALLSHTRERFPGLASLMWVVNTKLNDTIGDLEIRLHSGRDHIFEEMESLRFKVGPKSFYQTNSSQAYELYKIVREFAALTGQETVYDLYTGTGTIANFVAARASRVIGVEYVPEAIEDARTNSRLNGINNTTFYAGDMKDVLDEAFVERNGRPDVVILDPPRAGIHEDVARTILGAAPGRIVYVSCNPATQARDLALLDADYRVLRIQPVDMFPHTHHVENVVLLVRRDRSESDPGQD